MWNTTGGSHWARLRRLDLGGNSINRLNVSSWLKWVLPSDLCVLTQTWWWCNVYSEVLHLCDITSWLWSWGHAFTQTSASCLSLQVFSCWRWTVVVNRRLRINSQCVCVSTPVCVCVCVFLHLLHLFVCNINVLRQLSPSMFLSDSDIYAVISWRTV